jgi:hypothetical protein
MREVRTRCCGGLSNWIGYDSPWLAWLNLSHSLGAFMIVGAVLVYIFIAIVVHTEHQATNLTILSL